MSILKDLNNITPQYEILTEQIKNTKRLMKISEGVFVDQDDNGKLYVDPNNTVSSYAGPVVRSIFKDIVKLTTVIMYTDDSREEYDEIDFPDVNKIMVGMYKSKVHDIVLEPIRKKQQETTAIQVLRNIGYGVVAKGNFTYDVKLKSSVLMHDIDLAELVDLSLRGPLQAPKTQASCARVGVSSGGQGFVDPAITNSIYTSALGGAVLSGGRQVGKTAALQAAQQAALAQAAAANDKFSKMATLGRHSVSSKPWGPMDPLCKSSDPLYIDEEGGKKYYHNTFPTIGAREIIEKAFQLLSAKKHLYITNKSITAENSYDDKMYRVIFNTADQIANVAKSVEVLLPMKAFERSKHDLDRIAGLKGSLNTDTYIILRIAYLLWEAWKIGDYDATRINLDVIKIIGHTTRRNFSFND